jgi:hypothetical protein
VENASTKEFVFLKGISPLIVVRDDDRGGWPGVQLRGSVSVGVDTSAAV